MPDYEFVDQPDTLTETLQKADCLAVDTEFMREKTYFAQLCLVQAAVGNSLYCIDPLREPPGAAFWEGLLQPRWIVHSARQDIEVVFQTANAMPRQIFDTQIAAALTGLPPQIGYAGLCKELFDVDMAKSHTRADWTRRPLPDAFLQYAAEDVEYLLPAADSLTERLDRLGRLHWAEQDSALLLDPMLYSTGSSQAIERLKGARRLRGKPRAAAMRLAVWREKEAIARNRPRQWILRDKQLLDIAQRMPQTTAALETIDGLSPKMIKRVGAVLLRELKAAASDDKNYPSPRPPSEAQKALLKELQAKVADCAEELSLPAEVIAPKKELSAIVMSNDRSGRVLQGWRADLIGHDLLKLL